MNNLRMQFEIFQNTKIMLFLNVKLFPKYLFSCYMAVISKITFIFFIFRNGEELAIYYSSWIFYSYDFIESLPYHRAKFENHPKFSTFSILHFNTRYLHYTFWERFLTFFEMKLQFLLDCLHSTLKNLKSELVFMPYRNFHLE